MYWKSWRSVNWTGEQVKVKDTVVLEGVLNSLLWAWAQDFFESFWFKGTCRELSPRGAIQVESSGELTNEQNMRQHCVSFQVVETRHPEKHSQILSKVILLSFILLGHSSPWDFPYFIAEIVNYDLLAKCCL